MKMTKYFLVVALCCLMHQMNAQISLGVKSGYTKAWEYYGDVEVPDDGQVHIHGFHVNALAYMNIHKFVQLGIEPGFIRRGANCVPGFDIFIGDTKLQLNHVELPVMVSGKVPIWKSLSVYGKAGYGVSMVASAYRERMEMDWGSGDVKMTRTKMEMGDFTDLHRWDHGLHGALGLSIKAGFGKLLLESDYYYGLKDAARSTTSKNRTLNVSLGYMIDL